MGAAPSESSQGAAGKAKVQRELGSLQGQSWSQNPELSLRATEGPRGQLGLPLRPQQPLLPPGPAWPGSCRLCWTCGPTARPPHPEAGHPDPVSLGQAPAVLPGTRGSLSLCPLWSHSSGAASGWKEAEPVLRARSRPSAAGVAAGALGSSGLGEALRTRDPEAGGQPGSPRLSPVPSAGAQTTGCRAGQLWGGLGWVFPANGARLHPLKG